MNLYDLNFSGKKEFIIYKFSFPDLVFIDQFRAKKTTNKTLKQVICLLI